MELLGDVGLWNLILVHSKTVLGSVQETFWLVWR
jgi:hypothetical protein